MPQRRTIGWKDIQFNQTNIEMAEQFWKDSFAGLEAAQYPSIPIGYQPTLSRIVEHEIRGLDWSALNDESHSISTKLSASWALLLAQYANTEDVVFGRSVSDIEVAHDSSPLCIRDYTFPLRVQVDWTSTLRKWLQDIQSQATGMEALHDPGCLDRIRLCSPQAQKACDFSTILVVQDATLDEV